MMLHPESEIHRSNYVSALHEATVMAWRDAYARGYNEGMGDHRNYYYSAALQEAGTYELLASARHIVEYGPGRGDFMRPLLTACPGKSFHFVEIAEANAQMLRRRFDGMPNLTVHLAANAPAGLVNVDFAFSFLLSQCMPATLWREHLAEVRQALHAGGTYVFQFGYRPSGEANDSPAVAVAGSQMYSPERMTALVKSAEFENVRIVGPIGLGPFHTDIVWYICRAQK